MGKLKIDDINVFDNGFEGILPQIGKNMMENSGLQKLLDHYSGKKLDSVFDANDIDAGVDEDIGEENPDGTNDIGDDIDTARETMKARRGKGTAKNYRGSNPTAGQVKGLGSLTDVPEVVTTGIDIGLDDDYGQEELPTEIDPVVAPAILSEDPEAYTGIESRFDKGEIDETEYMRLAEVREKHEIRDNLAAPQQERAPVKPSKLTAADRAIIASMNPDIGSGELEGMEGLTARQDDFLSPKIQAQVFAATGKKISRFSQLKRIGL